MSNLDKQLIYVHKYHPNDQDQPVNRTGILPPKTTHVLVSASGWRALQNVMVATETKEKFKEAQVLVLPIIGETDIIDANKLLDIKEKDDGSISYRYLNKEAVIRSQYALAQISDAAFFEYYNQMRIAKTKTQEELEEALSAIEKSQENEKKLATANAMADGIANAWSNRKDD